MDILTHFVGEKKCKSKNRITKTSSPAVTGAARVSGTDGTILNAINRSIRPVIIIQCYTDEILVSIL